MTGVWVVLAVGCLAFIATNVDGFLVLLVFFSDRYATRQAIIGQYLGLSVLIAAFVAASLLALVIRLVPVPRGSQRPSRRSARMIPPPRCAGSKAVRMARDGAWRERPRVRATDLADVSVALAGEVSQGNRTPLRQFIDPAMGFR